MAAVEVGTNGRVNWRSVQRLGQARRVAADKLMMTTETGVVTTATYTFVYTPATGSITIDYSES